MMIMFILEHVDHIIIGRKDRYPVDQNRISLGTKKTLCLCVSTDLSGPNKRVSS